MQKTASNPILSYTCLCRGCQMQVEYVLCCPSSMTSQEPPSHICPAPQEKHQRKSHYLLLLVMTVIEISDFNDFFWKLVILLDLKSFKHQPGSLTKLFRDGIMWKQIHHWYCCILKSSKLLYRKCYKNTVQKLLSCPLKMIMGAQTVMSAVLFCQHFHYNSLL